MTGVRATRQGRCAERMGRFIAASGHRQQSYWRHSSGVQNWHVVDITLRSKAAIRDVQVHQTCKSMEDFELRKNSKDNVTASNRSFDAIAAHAHTCTQATSFRSVEIPSRLKDPTPVAAAITTEPSAPLTQGGICEKAVDFDSMLAVGCGAALTCMAMDAVESSSQSCFHSSAVPNLSLSAYLERMRRFFYCSSSCFVLALLYVDRLVKCNPHIRVTPLTKHRLALVAMLVAVKFNEDTFYSNAYYAKVGGVTTKELNSLERNFLHMLDWKVAVDEQEYDLYHGMVCEAANVTKS